MGKHLHPQLTSGKHPLSWIPSLYFAEGIPYVIVTVVSMVMYKRMGLSNVDIALYTSWLQIPWVIKPFWSPIVDMLRTKRWWILLMQLVIGAGLAGVAFTLPASHFVQYSLALFFLLAFSSATHDIAADGFYMLELTEHEQTLYVGMRNTCYRIATIAGQGLLVSMAGFLEAYLRQPIKAWMYTFWAAAALFFALYGYHYFFMPDPEGKQQDKARNHLSLGSVFVTFFTFFQKPHILTALAFMLLFRLPEALLSKICPLFLMDPYTQGGLGLSTSEIGLVQGTVGVIGLLLGGIIGGIAVARDGFSKWLWPMVLSISVPDILYILLAYFQPSNLFLINVCVFIEQFGYGFGFTAYMLYLLYFSQGKTQTAHYAFCTGFMSLGMMLPGMCAGYLQDLMGYLNFFIFVVALVPVTFAVSALIKVDPHFGKKDVLDMTEDVK